MATTSKTAKDKAPETVFDRFKRRVAERVDSWVNPYTGYGSDRDKTSVGYFLPDIRIEPLQALQIWEGDPIAARIVDTFPREILRGGFTLTYRCDDDAERRGDAMTEEEMKLEMKRLNVVEQLTMGLIMGRATGRAIGVIGADDGRRSDEPLDVRAIRSVKFIQIYDGSRVHADTWISDPAHPRFGMPRTYRVDSLDGVAVGDGGIVHESRCLLFRGAPTSDRTKREIDGRDLSVLQRPYDAIRKFHEDHKVSSLLMTDASQGVWRMAGFLDAVAAGDYQAVIRRLIETETARGVARAIIVDPSEDEDFTKVQNAFSGISDMLDRSGNYLAAACELPVTVLMGQAPAGLAATGDSDVRVMYDGFASRRPRELDPLIMRLVEVLTRGRSKGWEVSYPPLWQELPGEKADRRLKEAQRDQIYIVSEVVRPEEVALAPHLDDVYPNVDRDELRALLAEEKLATTFEGGETGSASADAPQLEIAPTDVATTVTVNEVRKSRGLPPVEWGDITIAEHKARIASTLATAAAAEQGEAAPSAPPAGAPAAPATDVFGQPAAAETEDDESATQDEEAARFARELNDYVNPKTGEKGAPRCEHRAMNRCTKCGIERVRRVVGSNEEGEPIYGVEWRVIGAKVMSGGEAA